MSEPRYPSVAAELDRTARADGRPRARHVDEAPPKTDRELVAARRAVRLRALVEVARLERVVLDGRRLALDLCAIFTEFEGLTASDVNAAARLRAWAAGADGPDGDQAQDDDDDREAA
jgi:hypothetical protein